jgi:hypothetical protein
VWYQDVGKMANQNQEVRPNSDGFAGSSSLLSSIRPVSPSPWHSLWSCPLWLALRPVQNDPSSSNPLVRPTLPPFQPQSTPSTSSNHCEECSRLLDTVLILQNLVFELWHDLAYIRFKLDLMDRRGESMAIQLHTLFTPEAKPEEVVSNRMEVVGVILLRDTTQTSGPQS